MDRGAWWATVHGVVKSPAHLSNQHLLTYLIITNVIYLQRDIIQFLSYLPSSNTTVTFYNLNAT